MSSSDGREQAVSNSDPFSEPDVYYGDDDKMKGKEHRRAFSSVCSDPRPILSASLYDAQ